MPRECDPMSCAEISHATERRTPENSTLTRSLYLLRFFQIVGIIGRAQRAWRLYGFSLARAHNRFSFSFLAWSSSSFILPQDFRYVGCCASHGSRVPIPHCLRFA